MNYADGIPVVSIHDIAHGYTNNIPSEEDYYKTGTNICDALRNIGFVYLSDHGISLDLIERTFKSAKEFFDLPYEKKLRYRKTSTANGYVPMNSEKLYLAEPNSNASQELKEAYDIKGPSIDAYENHGLAFKPDAKNLIEESINLYKRILKAIECSLGLKQGTLLNKHEGSLNFSNGSLMRLLHYPPVDQSTEPNAVRCGVHSDYGTFTMLFQDSMGGLEVLDRNNQWQAALPIKGTILINVGDLLEYWTSEELIATKHKVVVPGEEIKKQCSRQSIVLFVHPRNDVVMEPLLNKNSSSSRLLEKLSFRNNSFTAGQYLKSRYDSTYTD